MNLLSVKQRLAAPPTLPALRFRQLIKLAPFR
jgi:hypothetical protein